MKKFLDFSFFKKDLLGGLTAGIVALPLALAFGEQSGMGAAAGLYGAAFIAFFASLFGGTPTQISGPTAPMTALSMVVVGGILQSFEGQMERALPVILVVFLLAGLFQMLMAFLKFGTYIKFIPQPVVSGFMTGIGVIILVTQILPAVGYYAGQDEVMVDASKPHAEELMLDRIIKEEAEDGVLVLEEFNQTIDRTKEILPANIEAEAKIIAANKSKGVIGSIMHLPRALQQISLVDFLLMGMVSQFDINAFAPYILTALMLALLGAIDSLLTSVVADNMTKTQHDPNQELLGQGIGNSIASFFGGIPGAGATIRTVVNIQAGGQTKLSGMIAGVFIFIIVIVLGPIASKIPAAVLAGILITFSDGGLCFYEAHERYLGGQCENC